MRPSRRGPQEESASSPPGPSHPPPAEIDLSGCLYVRSDPAPAPDSASAGPAHRPVRISQPGLRLLAGGCGKPSWRQAQGFVKIGKERLTRGRASPLRKRLDNLAPPRGLARQEVCPPEPRTSQASDREFRVDGTIPLRYAPSLKADLMKGLAGAAKIALYRRSAWEGFFYFCLVPSALPATGSNSKPLRLSAPGNLASTPRVELETVTDHPGPPRCFDFPFSPPPG